jgi:hypothetical protein
MRQAKIDEDIAGEPPDIPPPVPAFSWMGSLSPLFLVPIACVVLIALLAPNNVLDQWPLAKVFTNWMLKNLPFMNRHADSTNYPQVALLVNCLTVFFIPTLGVIWLIQSVVNYKYLLKRNKATKAVTASKHLFIVLFGPPCFFTVIYFLVGLAGDPSWAKDFTTSNRWGIALLNSGLRKCNKLHNKSVTRPLDTCSECYVNHSNLWRKNHALHTHSGDVA